MTDATGGPDRASGFHGYPCRGPGYGQNGYTTVAVSAEWDAALRRCDLCGSLWEAADRSIRRLTRGAALAAFPGAEIPPFTIRAAERAGPPLRYRAHLNQGAVYRLYLEVLRGGATEVWGVLSGGELRPLATLDAGPLEDVSRDRFDELLLAEHGPLVAATVTCALAGGLHPRVLKALDLTATFGDGAVDGPADGPGDADGSSVDEVAAGLVRRLVDTGRLTVEDLRVEGLG